MNSKSENKASWSKEPWKAVGLGYGIEDADGVLICQTAQGHLTVPVEEANAARIVACVNFCATIPSEELNLGFLKAYKDIIRSKSEDVSLLQMELHRIRAQLQAVKEENESLKVDVHNLTLVRDDLVRSIACPKCGNLNPYWDSIRMCSNCGYGTEPPAQSPENPDGKEV